MGDEDLNLFMAELLEAEAYRCGSPISKVCVNTEGKAKDDGSDGWTAKPVNSNDWLGSDDTCWQFKAGVAGQPAKLAGEVTKRIPKETLTDGGRFVVVASDSTNGKKGENDRLAVLIREASAAEIPCAKIDVIGSERLAIWCNCHPAVAAPWAGRPDGLWTFEDWSNSEEHQVPWQASVTVQTDLDAQRAALGFYTGSVHHFHIQGPPGVGKTRLALELCREAAWRSAVIYIRNADDVRLPELIDSVAADVGVQLIVVADEVQPEDLRPLRDSVERTNGRARLISIGHSPSPDPRRIPAMLVVPLEPEVMQKVIKGFYPSMPPEHVDFVVRFADGYVRLARLAADAVARNPAMNVRGLLSHDEIRGFLDGMLGPGDRCALYVVAVLTSVGWTEDKQVEGQAVAEHFSLDWNMVRATVEDFHRRLGIAPRGGRYRYVSPTPLGIHLAVEAWTIYADLLRSLPGVLPSEEARDAYYERLQSMASNPQAQVYAREELGFFFRLDDFIDDRAVRRWSALSAADPDAAARNILRALSVSSREDRNRIADRARREVVWTLVRLAWRSSAFHDTVKALALLAEAENETWANNATGEFVARFQVLLGGTAVPYLVRLSVLDELLADGRPTLVSLVVKALVQVGSPQASRTGISPASDQLPEREWCPNSGSEVFECTVAAIARLSDIAKRGIPGLQVDLFDAAKHLRMMLRQSPLRSLVVAFFDAVREAYPATREPLRREIADIIHNERKHWKELSEEELAELETLHARFEATSLLARLQQHVGQAQWDREELTDLNPLAKELLSEPSVLSEHWSWLTSGEAWDAWRLGEALAVVDSDGRLAETMPSLPGAGPDLRLLCGYINARRQSLGEEWFEGWLAAQFDRDPKPVPLLFEVAWRCGVSESMAIMLGKMLRSGKVHPTFVGQLEFGRWSENLSADVLQPVIRAMVDAGYRQTAVRILSHRMESNSGEVEGWKPLALELVTASDLIRSGHTSGHAWKKVANAIIADQPGQIAAAIFREQADRKSGNWFAEYSPAAQVLMACVKQDPSAVWRAMRPYLSASADAYVFGIGFPRGVLEGAPPDEVRAWIAENPEEHAATLARLTSKDFSTDETLTAQILGEYGDNEQVASAFFCDYTSGSWWGLTSMHWDELAETLEAVAARASLPKLRRWAADSARSLRMMAERDRQREEEEELRGR